MGGTVTVACKMPNGLILRVFDMVDHDEPVAGGGTKPTKRAIQRPETVEVRGNSAPFGAPIHTVGGYALTTGVDAEFFDKWLAQNADHDAVRNKVIFAHARQDSAGAQAKEQAEVTSGLEPLNPEKDKRAPKGVKKNTGKDAE